MIFVLAGTSDGRELARAIHKEGFPLIVSVVTQNAARAIEAEGISVLTNRLNKAEMLAILKELSVDVVIDASHPFAEEVSTNMIKATQECNVPYIRFEREIKPQTGKRISYVKSYEEAAERAGVFEGNIMLTTGAKTLSTFASRLVNRSSGRTLYRLLPIKENLQKCELLGIHSKDIVAIQGPFTKEFNKALFSNFSIDLLITKDSGESGSLSEKVEAAEELGMETIIIERPRITYGTVFHTFEEIIHILKKGI